MDTRLSPVGQHIPVAPQRLDQGGVQGAVRTDLAPPIAVAAQAGTEQSRFTRERRQDGDQPGQKSTHAALSTDRETGELVFRVLDSGSETLIAQYPNESILKLRAYIDAVDEKNARRG
jgi:hypothetical protein